MKKINFNDYNKSLKALQNSYNQRMEKQGKEIRKEKITISSAPSASKETPVEISKDKKINEILKSDELHPRVLTNLFNNVNSEDQLYGNLDILRDDINIRIKTCRFLPSVFSSITAMKRRSNILTKEEETMFALLVEYNNKGRERLYDYEEQEIIGKIKKELIPTIEKMNNPVEKDAKYGETIASDELIKNHSFFETYDIKTLMDEVDIGNLVAKIIDQYYTLLLLLQNKPKINQIVEASIWYIENVIYKQTYRGTLDLGLPSSPEEPKITHSETRIINQTLNIINKDTTGIELFKIIDDAKYNFKKLTGAYTFKDLKNETINVFKELVTHKLFLNPKIYILHKMNEVDRLKDPNIYNAFIHFLEFYEKYTKLYDMDIHSQHEFNKFIQGINEIYKMLEIWQDNAYIHIRYVFSRIQDTHTYTELLLLTISFFGFPLNAITKSFAYIGKLIIGIVHEYNEDTNKKQKYDISDRLSNSFYTLRTVAIFENIINGQEERDSTCIFHIWSVIRELEGPPFEITEGPNEKTKSNRTGGFLYFFTDKRNMYDQDRKPKTIFFTGNKDTDRDLQNIYDMLIDNPLSNLEEDYPKVFIELHAKFGMPPSMQSFDELLKKEQEHENKFKTGKQSVSEEYEDFPPPRDMTYESHFNIPQISPENVNIPAQTEMEVELPQHIVPEQESTKTKAIAKPLYRSQQSILGAQSLKTSFTRSENPAASIPEPLYRSQQSILGAQSLKTSFTRSENPAASIPKTPAIAKPVGKPVAKPLSQESQEKTKKTKKTGQGFTHFTPQQVQLLIMAYEAGNSSSLIKNQIIKGLNNLVKQKIISSTIAKKRKLKLGL